MTERICPYCQGTMLLVVREPHPIWECVKCRRREEDVKVGNDGK